MDAMRPACFSAFWTRFATTCRIRVASTSTRGSPRATSRRTDRAPGASARSATMARRRPSSATGERRRTSASGLELAHVDDVVDEGHEPLRGARDAVEVAPGRRGVGVEVEEALGVAVDQGERGAELVRDGGHEAGLGLVERPGRAQVAQDAHRAAVGHGHARDARGNRDRRPVAVADADLTADDRVTGAEDLLERAARPAQQTRRARQARLARGVGAVGRRRVAAEELRAAHPRPGLRRRPDEPRRGSVEAHNAPSRVDGHDGVGGPVENRRQGCLLAREGGPKLGCAQRDRQLEADRGEVAGMVGLEGRPGIGADGQVPDRPPGATARLLPPDGSTLGQRDPAPAAGRRPPRGRRGCPRTGSGRRPSRDQPDRPGRPGRWRPARAWGRPDRRARVPPRRPPMLGPPRPGPRRRARRHDRRPRGAG